jgi:hypothetical protein
MRRMLSVVQGINRVCIVRFHTKQPFRRVAKYLLEQESRQSNSGYLLQLSLRLVGRRTLLHSFV